MPRRIVISRPYLAAETLLIGKVAIPRGHVACPVKAVNVWREAAPVLPRACCSTGVLNMRAQRVGNQRLTPRIVADIVKGRPRTNSNSLIS